MDWAAVALLVTEHAGLSAVLLGPRGELLMVAPAAESALGWRLAREGAPSLYQFVPSEAVEDARLALDRAMAGALRKLELCVLTSRGTCIARFGSSVVGRDDSRGILLLLEHLAPLVGVRPTSDYDYEVSGVTGKEYRLLRVWQPGSAATPASGKCFEVLHARSSPCDNCPLSRGETLKPLVGVSRQAPHDYLVTSATLRSDDCAHVSVRSVPSASFSAVMQARLDELAERAHLSKRERSVFAHLMEGRAVDDIASDLAISPRTVKFHQANVLQKLGADSRTDLIRLVF
ncbi:MAG: transcriptional regulator, LuxR family [Polyangiaceae bacterium]|jgi:DNA-binding CsgD family transcriptional regulator|nr:transcriptional regulator, LuxR family [Polyangiaceae bacterium]